MPKRIRKPDSDFGKTAPHLIEAVANCIKFAKENLFLGVGDVAEIMGMESKWILYKWVESGRIPFSEIPAFESACGCHFITQCLACDAHFLLIRTPDGNRAKGRDVYGLQRSCTDAAGKMLDVLDGKAPIKDAISALNTAMEEIAFLRQQLANQEKAEI